MQEPRNFKLSLNLVLLIVLGVVLVPVTVILMINRDTTLLIFIILAVLFTGYSLWMIASAWWPKTRKAGYLVYQVGFDRKTFYLNIIYTVISALSALGFIFYAFSTSEEYFWISLISFYYLLWPFYFFSQAFLNKTEIRENGIIGDGTFTRWDNIEAYALRGRNSRTLRLTLKKGIFVKTRKFPIPLQDREAVNQILADRVLSWQEQVSPQS